MDLSARPCPYCGPVGKTELLSTTNEWKYYCGHCKQRFNDKGEVQPRRRD